jgi:starvation-inducible DNA-binding protein
MPPKSKPSFTIPTLSLAEGAEYAAVLQERLHALNDLALTLKHVHWNVVGPHFIGVHEMIDPQVDAVREMVDEVAERVATLGTAPVGTPGALVAARGWEDYSIGRADSIAHLGALDLVYDNFIADYRKAATAVEGDPVSNDLLIGHLHKLELFHWFVRAHLESAGGTLSDAGADTEKDAAEAAETAAEKGGAGVTEVAGAQRAG